MGLVTKFSKMELHEMIEIAKAGFPDRFMETINWQKLGLLHFNGVHLLYYTDESFCGDIPSEEIMSIVIGEDDFVQFGISKRRTFDHYAAIRKMEELGLIGDRKRSTGGQ